MEDVARDLARRRYADNVVKTMMIETWLNDGIYKEGKSSNYINLLLRRWEKGGVIRKSNEDFTKKYK